MFENMKGWLEAAAIVAAVGGAAWAMGKYLPGIIVKKLHAAFEAVRGCEWIRNPARPKRAAWLVATLVLLEDELPEPGAGKEFYAELGAGVAKLSPMLIGTGPKWAAALEKIGDAIDTELDDEIKELAAPPPAT